MFDPVPAQWEAEVTTTVPEPASFFFHPAASWSAVMAASGIRQGRVQLAALLRVNPLANLPDEDDFVLPEVAPVLPTDDAGKDGGTADPL